MPNAVRVHPNPPLPQMTKRTTALTVRLLESGAGTLTTELLGLAPTGIGDEEAAVELDEGALQDVLGVLVDVLGVVGDNSLGNSLAHSVNLRSVTTTSDLDSDIDGSEVLGAEDEDGLVELGPEDLGGEKLQRLAVDLDEATALHSASDGCGILLLAKHLDGLLFVRHFELLARMTSCC